MARRKRHNSTSFMIRMIDVVFILLFGFVAVSQISQAEAIEPPASEEANRTAPEGTDVLIVVVTEEGAFRVQGGEREFARLRSLAAHIRERAGAAARAGQELQVRIRTSWQTPIAKALSVAKLCRDLGVIKGIDVVKASGAER